jgi:hypothetical protein
MGQKEMNVNAQWVPWQLGDDENAGKFIVTTKDGEIEICGIVHDPKHAPMIAVAPRLLRVNELAGAAIQGYAKGHTLPSVLINAWAAMTELGAMAKSWSVDHDKDDDCFLDPETNSCVLCDVYHGDPCARCGQRAFHNAGCPEIEGAA